MVLTQLKPLVQLVALLALASCASAPKTPESVNRPVAELASVVGNAEQGAMVQLPAGNSLGVDAVTVERTYFAASGRECRRLRDVSGAPLQRVACKGQDGVWRFARDLRTSGLRNSRFVSQATQPLVPSAGSALLLNNELVSNELVIGAAEPMTIDLDPSPIEIDVSEYSVNEQLTTDSVPRELYVNETLWSFAKRTTGNALNWQAIAEHNGIVDAKTLAPGAVLNIPVELVGSGG